MAEGRLAGLQALTALSLVCWCYGALPPLSAQTKRAMAQAVVTGSIQNTQSEVKAHESIPDFADAHFTSELLVDLVEPGDGGGSRRGTPSR